LAASARRGLLLGGLCLASASIAQTPQPTAELKVTLEGLRSSRGVVRLCLTQATTRFLECKDKAAAMLNVPAGQAANLALPRLKPGNYALLVIHDENGNGKLDMAFGIPREGFGFSNNPTIHMRAPKAQEVRFALAPGKSAQTIRMHYIL
jgi:uncharacterized protein (DUF2141 family)